ncbi:MAG: hypothetical protein AB7T49_21135 [Oligoflexales bacterium]
MATTEMETHLKALTDSLENSITNAQQNGEIQQHEETYYRNAVKGDPDTPVGTSWQSQNLYITRLEWPSQSIHFILDKIKKTDNYQKTLNIGVTWVGNDHSGGCNFQTYLDQFLMALISKRLSEGQLSSEYIAQKIVIFMKEVQGQPINYTAIVELDGLKVDVPRIALTIDEMGVLLRPVLNKDLERECRLDALPFQIKDPLQTPMAILEIQKTVSWPNQIQVETDKIQTLLSLYCVVSLRDLCTRFESDSFSPISRGVLHSGVMKKSSLHKGTLQENDIEPLKRFVDLFYSKLPQNIYDASPLKKDDFLAIAHQRYCDALLEGGIIEKRIATIVMGLESLLLFESQEVSYRFRKRGAKILGLLIDSPSTEIQTVLKEAYNIRSTFVHGEHLSSKSKEKIISKLPALESLEDMEKQLLDYLRKLLVVYIGTNKAKQELMALVDDALIEDSKSLELSEFMKEYKVF